jgi:hypothetical protein
MTSVSEITDLFHCNHFIQILFLYQSVYEIYLNAGKIKVDNNVFKKS